MATSEISINEKNRMTKTERLNGVLRSLRTSSPEIIGATVVTSDGFIVASHIPNEVDEDLIGGMAASLLGVGERIAADLMRADVEQTYVRSAKGYIIVNAIGAESVLVLLVTREAKLGMIFLELKRTLNLLAEHLDN
ncbi:MAG TPA: roadblock/LC7 domain-containing protein [Polyangiaceae bacterium]|nr:roadblock/LC7 domain-containing protein [Polyangiaceae bacterium]